MYDIGFLSDIQKKLLEKNIINLHGDVKEDMFHYVLIALAELEARGSPPMEGWITSRGGNAGTGLDIHDAIRAYPGESTGIGKGFVYSAAANFFQAFKTRLAYKNTSLLYHNATSGDIPADTLDDPDKWDRHLRRIERTKRVSFENVRIRTGLQNAEIEALFKRNEYIYPEEAIDLRLLDKII